MKTKKLNLILDKLHYGLIVSCQPIIGSPMDRCDIITAFGLAALYGGAVGLRVEGSENVRSVRKQVDQSIIIGLIKRDLDQSQVKITPWLSDIDTLIEGGADIIAFDATQRPRPYPVKEMIERIHSAGAIAMADCANFEEGETAHRLGADLIATTLSGYTQGEIPEEPDLALITELKKITPLVIAEGRFNTPLLALRAIECGAYSVVVGSAITRTEQVTQWFVHSMGRAHTKPNS